MNVAFAYNIKKKAYSTDLKEQTDIEFDSPEVIEGITKTLQSLGHTVYKVEADEDAYCKLQKLKKENKVDIVFNVAEGKWGDARESQIPMFCEVLKIPYTHSTPSTQAITLDKQFTKWILEGADVARAPQSQTIISKDFKFDKTLKFPLIVKPNKEGSSKGILDKNVVYDFKNLKKIVNDFFENYKGEVLIEEYIDGREFTVSVMGNNGDFRVLPIIEQKFDFLPKGMHKMAGYELKWIYEDNIKDLHDAYECPAKIPEKLKKEIEETTKLICKVLDIRDAARVDYRMNKKGELYFLEINTLPGINPSTDEISYFPIAARTAGLDYKKMIGEILFSACKRYKIKTPEGCF